MDANSLKPHALILIGLVLAWLAALLLFTPVYEVLTTPPTEIVKIGVVTLADLKEYCASSLGSLSRLVDQEARRACSFVGTIVIFSYLALVVGVGMLVTGAIMKQQWGSETAWYVGFAIVAALIFVLFASYHIVATAVPGGTTYQGRFF